MVSNMVSIRVILVIATASVCLLSGAESLRSIGNRGRHSQVSTLIEEDEASSLDRDDEGSAKAGEEEPAEHEKPPKRLTKEKPADDSIGSIVSDWSQQIINILRIKDAGAEIRALSYRFMRPDVSFVKVRVHEESGSDTYAIVRIRSISFHGFAGIRSLEGVMKCERDTPIEYIEKNLKRPIK